MRDFDNWEAEETACGLLRDPKCPLNTLREKDMLEEKNKKNI